MGEGLVTLKPLVRTGDYRPEPPDCKLNFGTSKCKKRVNGGGCPTNCKETGVCGGWGPREGKLPLLSLVVDRTES